MIELCQCTSGFKGSEGIADLDAIILVMDFYRARNAGGFANLALPRNFYYGLSRYIKNQDFEKASSISDSDTRLEKALIIISNTVLASSEDKALISLSL
jgi:hypothetical protein